MKIPLLLRLLGIFGLLAIYIWWIEPALLTITEYDVVDPGRALENPIRILLLTDWHLGRFSRLRDLRGQIKRLARRHRRQPFDIVLLGGDFIDSDPLCLPRLDPLFELIGKFDVPVFAVLGNHDYTSFPGDITPLVERLTAKGVTVLRNQATPVMVGRQRLLIVGLDDLQQAKEYYRSDDYKSITQYRRAAEALDWYAQFDAREPDTPRLLLAHNPDAVYLPGRKPIAVLAGHTHGGQVMLLDWVSRRLHRQVYQHLPPGSIATWAGRADVNGRMLIVSHGIGGAALPIRMLRPPEAVIMNLH